jgi:hypothetical protein
MKRGKVSAALSNATQNKLMKGGVQMNPTQLNKLESLSEDFRDLFKTTSMPEDIKVSSMRLAMRVYRLISFLVVLQIDGSKVLPIIIKKELVLCKKALREIRQTMKPTKRGWKK